MLAKWSEETFGIKSDRFIVTDFAVSQPGEKLWVSFILLCLALHCMHCISLLLLEATHLFQYDLPRS